MGLGLVASLVIAFLFQVVVSQFESERYNHLLMAGILIFATWCSPIWLSGCKTGQIPGGAMTARIDAAIDGGNLFGLVLLAFLAVMREGFETVLFFSALVYSGQGWICTRG